MSCPALPWIEMDLRWLKWALWVLILQFTKSEGDVSSPALDVPAGASHQHQLMDGRQEHVPGSLLPGHCWDSSVGLDRLPDHLPPGVLRTCQAAQVRGCQPALLEPQLMYHPSLREAPWRQVSVQEVDECRPIQHSDTIYSTVFQAAIWTAISTDRSLEVICNGEGKDSVAVVLVHGITTTDVLDRQCADDAYTILQHPDWMSAACCCGEYRHCRDSWHNILTPAQGLQHMPQSSYIPGCTTLPMLVAQTADVASCLPAAMCSTDDTLQPYAFICI